MWCYLTLPCQPGNKDIFYKTPIYLNNVMLLNTTMPARKQRYFLQDAKINTMYWCYKHFYANQNHKDNFYKTPFNINTCVWSYTRIFKPGKKDNLYKTPNKLRARNQKSATRRPLKQTWYQDHRQFNNESSGGTSEECQLCKSSNKILSNGHLSEIVFDP